MPPQDSIGSLQKAAECMHESETVAIITGFPCMMDYSPPTETDGPLGALSLARTLLHLGKDVIILTDECNEEVLLACGAASGLMTAPFTTNGNTYIHTYIHTNIQTYSKTYTHIIKHVYREQRRSPRKEGILLLLYICFLLILYVCMYVCIKY